MYLFDVRPLQDVNHSGVHEVTRQLASALFKQVEVGDMYTVANSSRGAYRVREALGGNVPCLVRHWPNKFVHAGMRWLGKPTIEHLAGILERVTVIANPNFLAVRSDTILILIVHDLSYFRDPTYFRVRERLWHRSIGFAKLLERADRIVTFSGHTQADLVDLFSTPHEKIAVVTPGLASDASEMPDSQIIKQVRAKYKIPDQYLIMLGAGSRKNVHASLRALAEIEDKNIGLVVVGSGNHKKINKWAKNLGVLERVICTGHVTRLDRRAMLAGARALLYPSFYEGFGFPPIEALALGVPVIATRTTSLGEAVGDCAILVDPRDAGSITAAINRTIFETEATKRRIKRGRERAGQYSWDKTAKKLVQIANKARQSPMGKR